MTSIRDQHSSSTNWILPLLLVLSALLPFNASAAAKQSIEELIENHGKKQLIKFVLEKRGGEITVERDGRIINARGNPNPKLINSLTIRSDMQALNMDQTKFIDTFHQWIGHKSEAKQRAKAEEKASALWKARRDEAERTSRQAASQTTSDKNYQTSAGSGIYRNNQPNQTLTSGVRQQDSRFHCYRDCDIETSKCLGAAGQDIERSMQCNSEGNSCAQRCK